MIKVFTGPGKGKTTSAIGEGILALSAGKRVLMVQFLKGSTYSGELLGLYRLGIPLVQFGVGCRWSGMIRTGLRHCSGCGECFRQNRDPAIGHDLVQQGLTYLQTIVPARNYELIILDEVSHALKHSFLSLQDLRNLFALDPSLDWILTGREMPKELLDEADFWFELRLEKHPFQTGVKSRRGIEY